MELVYLLLVIPLGVWILKRLNGLYYSVKLGKKWSNLPPGHLGWPLFGSTLSFFKYFKIGQPQNYIRDFSIRYGKSDMYKTHLLGSSTILVCSPEISHRVLTDETTFAMSYPSSHKTIFGKKSLIQVSNGDHKYLRRLMTMPISGPVALHMYINHIEHTIISALEEWSNLEKPIEMLTEIKKLTFNVIWNIFMGSGSMNSTIAEMEHLFSIVSLGLFALPVNFPGFAYHNSLKARDKWMERLQSIVNEKRMLKERNGENWEAKDMMDLLIEVKDEDGKGMDDETISNLIFGMLFAGHGTSANTTMWALLFLTENPNILQRVKDEQEDIIKRRPSTQKGIIFSEYKQMKYLSQVIDETLRMSGLTFALFREATIDVEIKGRIIPKGWKVVTWLRENYRNENIHDSPHEFNPSRWDNYVGKPGTFNPFGIGSRMCAGRDLAKLEISIFLHYFFLNHKLERVNPECQLTYLTAPYPKDKCLARVLKVY